jgi:L-ascorbate metabolism protein UlaG (beta-lactamase superfamily)
MRVALSHLSTAGMLLEIGSIRLVTDPVLDTGLQRYGVGVPGLHLTRFRGTAPKAETLGRIDAILLSHPHHADNLDAGGRQLFVQSREIITNPHGKRHLQGVNHVTALAEWGSTTVFGSDGFKITVTATPALHGPRWLPGTHHVSGFVLEWEGQKNGALYISGDTIYFEGLRDLTNRFEVHTAILHLGGVNFWPPLPPFIRFTLTAADAVKTIQLLEPKQVIPIHYEQSVWSHFKEDVSTYVHAFQTAKQAHLVRWIPNALTWPAPDGSDDRRYVFEM